MHFDGIKHRMLFAHFVSNSQKDEMKLHTNGAGRTGLRSDITALTVFSVGLG